MILKQGLCNGTLVGLQDSAEIFANYLNEEF